MTGFRTLRAILLVVVALIVFQSGAVLAQDSEEAALPERKVIAWTNPILFVFTWYMAEIEIAAGDNATVGVSGSFLGVQTDDPGDPDYEDNNYTSVNAFVRYYPTASFKGFFIGAQIGFGSVSVKDNFEDDSGDFFLGGVLIGYGWLLGDAQRVGVSIGIGANRYFGGDLESDVSLTLPVIRLINVGIAF